MTLERDLADTAVALESGFPIRNLNRLRLRRGATMTDRKKAWAEMTDRNSKWFTWADILEMTDGKQEVTVRVVKASQGKIDQSNKRVVALTFDGVTKPLGLNATNAKAITSLYGTEYPSDWEAQRIALTLYIGRDKDPTIPGAMCNCVRVRNRKPADAQVRGAKYDHAAALALIAAATTVDDLTAARATIAAQKPQAGHHADLSAATKAAEERMKDPTP